MNRDDSLSDHKMYHIEVFGYTIIDLLLNFSMKLRGMLFYLDSNTFLVSNIANNNF